MSNPLLLLKDLQIGYNKPLVPSFSAQINKTEIVAIIGLNGTGKSTLIKTLARTILPISGSVFFGRQSIHKIPINLFAKQISTVFTQPVAIKNISVAEMVAYGRHPYTNFKGQQTVSDKRHIIESMRITKILQWKNKKCTTLSDGEFQRVLIAKTLAQDTPIILLDEPTTHLDIFHRAETIKLLAEIKTKKQKTILFSTHEIYDALNIADKVLWLNHKNPVFCTPKQLINHKEFNNGILSAINKSAIGLQLP